MPASPIRPAPTCSWRSVREPSSDFESFRWTITSRRIPISRSNAARSSSVTPGFERSYPAPQAWATSRQKPTRSSPMPRARDRLRQGGKLLHGRAQPEPAARGVLEDDHRGLRGLLHLGERPRHAVGEAIDARLDAGPSMRPDVHVDVACPEALSGPQLVGKDLHGALPERRLGPGQVHEVRGVDRDRFDPVRRQPAAKLGQLLRGSRSAAPGGRVVGEDLDRVRADLVRPLDGLHHPGAERKVGTEASTVRQHSRHRTMPARWIAQPVNRGSRRGRRGR